MTKIFSHYPSAALNDDTELGLGPMGSVFLTRGHQPLEYMELAAFLNKDVLYALTRHVAQEDTTIGNLKRWAAENVDLELSVAVLHFDWLIKHGVLVPKKNVNGLLRSCRYMR